jgi:enterobactin synthetase component D
MQRMKIQQRQDFLNPTFFPSINGQVNLTIVGFDYYQSAFNQSFFHSFQIPFPNSLNKAVIKRQSEYLAGRYAAIKALRILGFTTNNVPIGKNREPIWPDGVVGSITHTNSSAFCAIALLNDIKQLGIDHENWISVENVNEIKQSIINFPEDKLISQIDLKYEHVFTLVFSAKESLFKALFPSLQCYFDFKDAEIIYICLKHKKFTLKLTTNLSDIFKTGNLFHGSFNYDARSVQTLIATPQI